MKIEIYSDLTCPWCYIGERRLDQALASFPGAEEIEVVFRPFQVDPAAPRTPRPVRARLVERYGEQAHAMLARTAEVAASEGLVFDWERAQTVNTRTAHRLLRLAELESGAPVQRALAARLFEAHFCRGGDLSDRGLLAAAAEAAGMNGDRARAYLASDEGGTEVDAAFADALRRGIRSVPTFVLDGKHGVEGAQPVAVLLEVLREVGRGAATAG